MTEEHPKKEDMRTKDKRLVIDNLREREGIPYKCVSILVSFRNV